MDTAAGPTTPISTDERNAVRHRIAVGGAGVATWDAALVARIEIADLDLSECRRVAAFLQADLTESHTMILALRSELAALREVVTMAQQWHRADEAHIPSGPHLPAAPYDARRALTTALAAALEPPAPGA